MNFIKREKVIKLYYVGAKGLNFGDSINPIVFERLLNIKTKRGYPTYSDVIGIGSLMERLNLKDILNTKCGYFFRYSYKPIYTMGTGYKTAFVPYSKFLDRPYRKIIPLVLRGKLSHKTLENFCKKKFENVAYGDLGLIFNFLLNKLEPKKYSVGIIPHLFDYNNPIIYKLAEFYGKNACIINLEEEPLTVLEKIQQCETVLSSSLHGLIAADSLNIPNKRIKISYLREQQTQVDFKFNDYYSIFFDKPMPYCDVMNTPEEKYFELFKELTTEKIAQDYEISYSVVQEYQKILLKKGEELKNLF